MHGAASVDINYIEFLNDGGGRKTIIGVKYNSNYGYYIAMSVDGVFMYRNWNGTWSEKKIGSW